MNQELISRLEKKLLDQKKSLEQELENFAKRDKSLPGNWETVYPARQDDKNKAEVESDELQEYDSNVSVEYSLELKLRDVNIALGKIKAGPNGHPEFGGYGICEKCGEQISEERLLAYPEARTCIEHAEK